MTEAASVKPTCSRCQAHDDAIPTDEQLRRMASGISIDEARPYDPTPRTTEQEVAARMYAFALSAYLREFGIENAFARLSVTLECLKVSMRFRGIIDRQIFARRYINDRASYAAANDRDEEAENIWAEPTPGYPGKELDDAYLDQGRNAGAADYERQAKSASYLAEAREFAEEARIYGEIMRAPAGQSR